MNEGKRNGVVLALETQVWRAVVEKDATALSSLFADDYIEGTLEGKRLGKADIVTWSPQVDEISGYKSNSEKVLPLGEDAVLLNYHLTLDGTCKGSTIAPRERWATSIWRCLDGDWKCCFFQQSPCCQQRSTNP